MTVSLETIKLLDGTEKLKLTTPYHPQIPEAARALGGKWSAEKKVWYFDPRDSDRVRDVCRTIYGVDPLYADGAERVTARLVLPAKTLIGPSWFMLGREVVSRSGRDAGVRLGDGVIVLSGSFPASGGSVRNPVVLDGSYTQEIVLEIRDVPRALAEQVARMMPDNMSVLAPEVAPAAPSLVEQVISLARGLSIQERLYVAAKITE